MTAVADGIVTRDELLAMGCEEVRSQSGRRVYVIGDKVIAAECTKCNKVQRREEFSSGRKSFMGVDSSCKECRRKSYAGNREQMAKYYVDNQERIAKYREDNREWRSEYSRNWRVANREQVTKYNEDRRELLAKYYEDNRGRFKENAIRYREANPERVAEYAREYHKANPEVAELAYQRRRARKHALPDDLSAEQLSEISTTFYNTCSLSGEATDLHADHVIPIAIGHGGTTYGNMIPLSAELNQSKNASHLFEWFDANHVRFGLSREKFDALIEYLAEANEMTTQEYRKYTDWCFDNPRTIDATTGELVFINEGRAIS